MSVHRFLGLELGAAALAGEQVYLVHHGVHVSRDSLPVHDLRLPAAARRQRHRSRRRQPRRRRLRRRDVDGVVSEMSLPATVDDPDRDTGDIDRRGRLPGRQTPRRHPDR